MLGIDHSWRYMGFPVIHAMLALVAALVGQGESEGSLYVVKLWSLWIPIVWFLFRGRSPLWFLPLAASFPFWAWAAWITWISPVQE